VNRLVLRARRIAAAIRRRAAEIESWAEWFYPYRSLHLTRDGGFFLAVTFAIGLAALNTGHNLFYLIFAMLVSLIVVSGILSERSVKPIRVERRLPQEIFARSAGVFEVRLRNASRRAAYAIEVREAADRGARRSVGFVTRLEPGAERTFHALWTFEGRGRHRFRSLHLVTRFPFGLFEKVRIVPIPCDFLVYPAIGREEDRARAAESKHSPVRRDRLGEELLHLRPFLAEDDWRLIHWRVTARAGELMVKEQGRALDRPVAVFFDDRGPAGPTFERAIERATALVWQASRDGKRVDLYTFTASFRALGRDSLRRAFAFLAEVEPARTEAGEQQLVRWRAEIARGAAGVFVTAGDPPAIPPGTCVRVA
jgi:uncharacterized protein (DUF58 family)